MDIKVETIQQQIDSIKSDREEFLHKVNRQLGAYEGAIQSLELLLQNADGPKTEQEQNGSAEVEPPTDLLKQKGGNDGQ